jgi:hypothetical protein
MRFIDLNDIIHGQLSITLTTTTLSRNMSILLEVNGFSDANETLLEMSNPTLDA